MDTRTLTLPDNRALANRDCRWSV